MTSWSYYTVTVTVVKQGSFILIVRSPPFDYDLYNTM